MQTRFVSGIILNINQFSVFHKLKYKISISLYEFIFICQDVGLQAVITEFLIRCAALVFAPVPTPTQVQYLRKFLQKYWGELLKYFRNL